MFHKIGRLRNYEARSHVRMQFLYVYRPHLQGERINQPRYQSERRQAEREREKFGDVPPKRRLTFNGLNSIISQKIV
jgi:hypothetical protein